MMQLTLKGANGEETELKTLTPPAEMYEGLPDNSIARNVAKIYALLAGDIRNNTRNAPTFESEVKLFELYNAIEQSAKA